MTGRRSVLADSLVTAIAPAVWGSTYLVTTELLPPDRPLLAATVRALPAGLVLLIVGRALPTGIWWWRSLVLGTLNIGAFFFLLFVAAYHLPGGVAALVGSVQPVVVLGLAAIVLGERIRPVHVLACALGIGGVALLVLRSDAALDPVGVSAALGGAVCMASGIVLTKRWKRPVGVLLFTGWQLTAGGLVLLPALLLIEGLPADLDGDALTGFGYLVLVGSILGYSLWFRGADRLPAVAMSFLGFVSPLVAAVLGLIVLGQQLTAEQLVGAAALVAAIGAVQAAARRSTAAPPARTSQR